MYSFILQVPVSYFERVVQKVWVELQKSSPTITNLIDDNHWEIVVKDQILGPSLENDQLLLGELVEKSLFRLEKMSQPPTRRNKQKIIPFLKNKTY